MRYLKLFEKENQYKLFIEWENANGSGANMRCHDFNTEDEMIDFLNFMYELREFKPHSYSVNGYSRAGFSNSHRACQVDWIKRIAKKYSDKFVDMMPDDRVPGQKARCNNIHVEIYGETLSIVWMKSLKTEMISIPTINSKIELSIGNIYPTQVGVKIFGGTNEDYLEYEDFEHKMMDFKVGVEKYPKIKCVLSDCVIDVGNTYSREHYTYDRVNNKEVLKDSYILYSERHCFDYKLLSYVSSGDDYLKYVTSSLFGYDPNYQMKFHKALKNYYFVD